MDKGTASTFKGGCLCGAIRYELAAAPKHVSHCHCSMCRKASGAPAVTWAYAWKSALHVTHGRPAVYASSENAERHFCASCGSSLFFFSALEPDMIDIAVGTLDDPGALPPDHHNFIGDRISWLRLDDELPGYEGLTPDE